jgi:hypothetical protein
MSALCGGPISRARACACAQETVYAATLVACVTIVATPTVVLPRRRLTRLQRRYGYVKPQAEMIRLITDESIPRRRVPLLLFHKDFVHGDP